ncbi:VOC family protein [Acetanaerobacterium elongatum]|uniref:Catechol 2,3-dioxygenase n=1 Tax=Acetanaerobacterium elongatum TaxID=258515 RepID=A0A1H0E083_9FIRM|nr:VOC family protein [Acetanaerobacterium elongatum]SDN75696.1 Catechol 2,3-dioxygenase [Acetanaerobacterium elongatum]
MFRFAHANIIAKDAAKLIDFYKTALQCKSIGETRDIQGDWLDQMTGVPNAHIVGEHLCLPGYDDKHPTLEIFSYDSMVTTNHHAVNQCGIAHLAFEVDDVEQTLKQVLAAGGGQLGELVHATYADGRKATFVYAADIEGNILELQSWN